MTPRAQRISNRNSRLLENNSSPSKQRRKQFSNRNKNALSAFAVANGISPLRAVNAPPLHESRVTNYKSRRGLNG
jgi:hypothetical protein